MALPIFYNSGSNQTSWITRQIQAADVAIASGVIQSGNIGNAAVVSGSIASGQVSQFHLSSGAVNSGHIGNAAVVSGSIASGSIGQFHHASGSVTSGHIGDNAVVSGSIASGTVSRFHLASGAVNSGHIGDNAVVSGSVASGQIGHFHISSGAITSGQIGDNTVVSGSIASGQLSTYNFASGATVTRTQFVAPFVSGTAWTAITEEIVSGARAVALSQSGTLRVAMASISGRMPAIGVVFDNVASGIQANVYTVGAFQFTSGLADYSGYLGQSLYVGRSGQIVTTSGSFNSGGFLSGDVLQSLGYALNSGSTVVEVNAPYVSGGPSTTSLTSGSVQSGHLGNNSVVSGSIASGQVGQFHLSSGAVNSGHIGNNAVVSGSIASGQVSHFHIGDAEVQSGNIASGVISRFHLASGAVNSGHIGNNAVVSGSIASGQVSQNALASGVTVSILNTNRDFTAFGTQSGGRCMYMTASGYLSTADALSGHMPAFGILEGNTASGQFGTVRYAGPFYHADFDFSGYIGQNVYVGLSGLPVGTVPIASGQFQQKVGLAVAISGLLINVDQTLLQIV